MIFSRIYDLERFWCPREGVVGLDQWGYLHDPYDHDPWMGQPDTVPFQRIEDVPCLILLGEPGIGKSQWFKNAQNCLGPAIRSKGHHDFWTDLGQYDTAADVVDGVFHITASGEWLEGEHQLHLFLDSFDECLFSVPALPRRLLAELRKFRVERLSLRILCRTSEWPLPLEEELKSLWRDRMQMRDTSVAGPQPDETQSKERLDDWVRVFELAPLRRTDVSEILRGEGIHPEPFLREIQSRELAAFASRPQTLGFLVSTFQANGQFPSDQVELYREGCRVLCRESSRDRVDARKPRQQATDEIFAVAARLGALTVLANRHAILPHDVPTTEIKDMDLSLRDICRGFEEVAGQKVAVREDIVRETLNTGLFTGRAGGRMGWAHQTYADFLAAEYLSRNELPVGQIMTLIKHPRDLEGKIAPQFASTASWLSLMSPDVFEELMAVDPEILLQKKQWIGPRGPQEGLNERLVGTLLKLLDEGKLLDNRISRSLSLGDLEHPRLAGQLRPYISDRGKNFVVRRVAIRIAGENRVGELEHSICDIALDVQDAYRVRVPAAHALIRTEDDAVKEKLRPLALHEREDDPDDELKGCALMALWPNHILAEELFDALTPPKRPNFVGSYQGSFLGFALVDRMNQSHLPAALRWVQRQTSEMEQRSYFLRGIVRSVMALSYNHLENAFVLEEFVGAALHRLRQYQEIIPSDPYERKHNILFGDDSKRRCLIERIVRAVSESVEEPRSSASLIAGLSIPSDVQWLIGLFRHIDTPKAKDILALLIARFVDTSNPELFDSVYRLSEENPALAAALKPRLGPVLLESDTARMMRALYLQQTAQKAAHEDRTRVVSCPQETIAECLNKIEHGNPTAFAALAWKMIEPERGSNPDDSLPINLTRLESWKNADDITTGRIISAAKAFPAACDPETDQWIGTERINWSALAGCIAFLVVLATDADSLDAIPATTWIKWAPAITACSSFVENSDSEALIAEAYRRVPEAIISNIVNQIDVENSSSQHVAVTDRLGKRWDDKLTQAILDKLNDPNLIPDSVKALLTAVSRHDRDKAVSFAKSQLQIPIPASGHRRVMALASAKVLVMNVPDVAWATIWPAVESDRGFGRDLISGLAVEAYGGLEVSFEQTPEDQLASLYAWLSKEYPSCDEEKPDRLLRAPRVHHLGESILSNLQNRGTPEAVRALRNLCKDLPEEADRLRWVLATAKDRTRAATWTPWLPEQILGVVEDHHKRIVESGDQLLRVVAESIERFQESLHGELPAVRDLWDRQVKPSPGTGRKARTWMPVDEPTLTDRVARHLKADLVDRGIVIGRELQIRPGESTDIHVDAVTRDTYGARVDIFKVIIEVKGCWNSGLETDMKAQLLDRYMHENDCRHGLYLIGWFYCDDWDEDDYRSSKPRKDITKMSIESGRQLFELQAAELSASGSKVLRAFVLDARRR